MEFGESCGSCANCLSGNPDTCVMIMYGRPPTSAPVGVGGGRFATQGKPVVASILPPWLEAQAETSPRPDAKPAAQGLAEKKRRRATTNVSPQDEEASPLELALMERFVNGLQGKGGSATRGPAFARAARATAPGPTSPSGQVVTVSLSPSELLKRLGLSIQQWRGLAYDQRIARVHLIVQNAQRSAKAVQYIDSYAAMYGSKQPTRPAGEVVRRAPPGYVHPAGDVIPPAEGSVQAGFNLPTIGLLAVLGVTAYGLAQYSK